MENGNASANLSNIEQLMKSLEGITEGDARKQRLLLYVFDEALLRWVTAAKKHQPDMALRTLESTEFGQILGLMTATRLIYGMDSMLALYMDEQLEVARKDVWRATL